MKNSIKPGTTTTVTIAGANVVSGDIGIYGSLIGVYTASALIGEQAELKTAGVFNLTKKDATEVLTIGMPLYKVAGESTVRTTGVATDIFIGLVDKDSGNGTTTVDCKLERAFSIALV